MNFLQSNLHTIITISIALVAVVVALNVLFFAVRRLSKAPKFAQWLDEIASGDNGKGSATRTCGIIGFLFTEGAFASGYMILCHKGEWAAAHTLFNANAWLVGAALGLVAGVSAANKMKNGDAVQPPAPAP